MNSFKIISIISCLTFLMGCASSYEKVKPNDIDYLSKNDLEQVTMQYKYDLLVNKYKKKESKNNVKLVALKITNNSEKDYIFSNDLNITFENGNSVLLLDNERIFQTLRQKPASHLWYLLLSLITINKTETRREGNITIEESKVIFPIGLIIGPGLAFGNLYAAADANKNFKNDLNQYNLIGKTIKKGETVYGLVGIQSNGYEGLKLKLN
jgi:hypothetical protein